LQSDAYDVVIASVHYILLPMGIHWTGDEGKSIFKYALKRIYHRYYEDLLAVAKLGGFDVLGHFDYPKRYLKCDAEEDELMAEILKTVVRNGSVIEINTSPLRKGCGETSPGKKILKMYKEAGGKRLTIGSDAHHDTDVAADLDQGLLLSKDFTVGYFKNREFYAMTGK
jgi:histidinol-phosphatase (PHP family)